ncbi:uncharacterized protein LOC128546066 [Mercenaria mercenaria]|uniref:uncharacterized protein LOC128546066 n=1 Tax=Mercenaria mercenaria TaxID=6596 RepID=UPI00234F5F17|nr:uncharacterized protein LOC128546066 [Mercenaria mercenaria]
MFISGHLECVKWLIANRSSLSAEDQLGRTPLDLAEEYQHQEVANFIRKCIDEAHDPNSSLHALRTSNRKGLDPIQEDRQRERNSDSMWQNDTNPDSARANVGSESEGRKNNVAQVKEKKRLYEEQQNYMERTHTSFLDSIRDQATH